MSRTRPGPDCYDVSFPGAYPLTEPAEVALEDYARTLTRSREAEAVRADEDPTMVKGIHLCGLGASPPQAVLADLEGFARELVTRAGSSGLGWG